MSNEAVVAYFETVSQNCGTMQKHEKIRKNIRVPEGFRNLETRITKGR
jgi:hypothetical protein